MTIVVPDYDEAIKYFTESLGFELRADDDRGEGKRWVLVAPSGGAQTAILLAKEQNTLPFHSLVSSLSGLIGY